MARAKTDFYRVTADLIANAVMSARVLGENPRITRLVAGSVGRYMREMDTAPGSAPGEELLEFALDCLEERGPEQVPALAAALRALGRAGPAA